MWAKVEGRYYFSKIPAFQNIRNKKNLIFEIPFNASDKEVTEVIVEVEMLSEGQPPYKWFKCSKWQTFGFTADRW